jgi:enoyl-CoA hydratase/carnithine racemase
VSTETQTSPPPTDAASGPTVTVERDGHVLLIGLNRPAKRNAFNLAMLEELGAAYELLEIDAELRCGVLFAYGEHFTGGLDLAEVLPAIQEGRTLNGPGMRDPWRVDGQSWTTPIVAAAQGRVLTLGIELLLAADVRVASADATFSQIEVNRGLYPFGGATVRLPRDAGWGNAMRWLLTGDTFDAAEALRIGLVQEVVEPGAQLERALAIARTIAEKAAPLGVKATLASAHRARREGEAAAFSALVRDVVSLSSSEDTREGLMSFLERREAKFVGR